MQEAPVQFLIRRSTEEGIRYPLQCSWASLVAQLVKNPPAVRETWALSLDWEDPLFLQSRSGLRPTPPVQFSSVTQSCLTLCDPVNLSTQASLSITKSQSPSKPMSIESVMPLNHLLFPSPGDLSNPGIETSSPALQVDSLPVEPPGKPRNTGVGSLSLLRGSS